MDPAQPIASSEADASLRNWKPRFFTVWTGQAFSLLGSSLVQFALVWWMTSTTRSATVLATATLVAMLPGIIIGPFAGALVDRWNRKRVMIVSDAAIALVTAVLIYLYSVGRMQLWNVYVVMFLRSLFGSFQWPAMQASTSLMVPREQLSRVAGMNQTLNGVMNIIAPPLGALLIAVLPLNGILAIDIITAGIAIFTLLLVHVPQPARSTPVAAGGPSLLHEVRDGLLYMWHWPGLFALLIMATLINFLLNPAFVLMPILVTKYFGGQALQLGTLESFWGIGVVAGGLLLSIWGGFRRRMLTSLVGLLGMGLGTLLIGLTPSWLFGLALVGMLIAGFMNPICNGPINAIVQAVVVPDMQARVMTVTSSMAGAMTPLSMLIAGPVADLLGVRVWYIAGGVGCLAMGLIALNIPAIMHLEEGGYAAHGNPADASTAAVASVAVPAAAGVVVEE